jgi:serralysin
MKARVRNDHVAQSPVVSSQEQFFSQSEMRDFEGFGNLSRAHVPLDSSWRAFAVDDTPQFGIAGCACLACCGSEKALKITAEGPQSPTLFVESPVASIKLIEPTPQFSGDDIADDISTTATLAIGSAVNSQINSVGDQDFFKVQLQQGQTYSFSLETTGGSSGLLDPFLELFAPTSPDGGLVSLASNDDGGIQTNSFLTFTATTSGTYFLNARAFSSETGLYTLSASTVAAGNSSPTTFIDNGKAIFSWDEAAIQLTRSGSSWAPAFSTPTTVTYAFRESAPSLPNGVGGFSQFNAAQIVAAEAALAAWAAVANISFVRVGDGTNGSQAFSNSAALLFGNYSTGETGAAAFAYLPSSGNQSAGSVQGDIWVNSTLDYNTNPVVGAYGPQVFLHEIGHAIGLSHPSDYNANENENITYGPNASYFNDSRMFSTMSYFGSINTGGSLGAFASLPQLHDIAAVQRLYGANTSTRAGDTIYGFGSNTGVTEFTLSSAESIAVFSIWDGGGTDVLDLSGYMTNSQIDLRPEAFSSAGPGNSGAGQFNISIARGAILEIAIGGGGNDVLIGNAVSNLLVGGAGADTLIGGAGADSLDGGAGIDLATFEFSAVGVRAALFDTALNTGEAIGDVYTSIEGLRGSSFADTLYGNNGANRLEGGSGNDWLLGLLGIDTLLGGAGDDLFSVDVFETQVVENANEGLDTIATSVNFIMPANVEVLRLFAPLSGLIDGYGNAANNGIVGTDGGNWLETRDGDDWMDGRGGNDQLNGGNGNDYLLGGDGQDTLRGGAGDDIYLIEDTFELLIEQPNEGVDLVYSRVDITLSENLEILRMLGASTQNATLNASDNIAIGTDFANRVEGRAGNDYIDLGAGNDTLLGGDGNDILVGGAGADRFNGGAGSDQFVFAAGAGADVIEDFTDGADRVVFSGAPGVTFASLTITQQGADTLIAWGGGQSITLININPTTITGDDFIFGG